MAGSTYFQRHNRLLTKLLQGKGGEPIESLAPELQPSIILENDRPEHQYLAETMLIAGGGIIGAVAGSFTWVELVNPPGSNLLVVVTHWINNVAATTRLGIKTGAAGIGFGNTAFRDSRWGATKNPPIPAQTLTQVADPLAGIALLRLATTGVWPVDIIITPGQALQAVPAAVNVGCDSWFLVRARTLEGSEI